MRIRTIALLVMIVLCGSGCLRAVAGENTLYMLGVSLDQQEGIAGGWVGVGAKGDWKETVAGTILDNRLYTTESNGALYVTDLATGSWKQIGALDFGDTVSMLATNEALSILRKDGSLYAVNLGNGSRVQVGPAQGWKGAVARVGLHNQLITAESNGRLYVSDLTNGVRTSIGEREFGNTKFMFSADDGLYTIETDGSLYRVYLKPGAGIGAYDWCPQEVEKVFRERGKGFYQKFAPRQINGAQSTRAGILAGFAWLQKSATKDDLVVIYVGCHGGTDPDKGWGIARQTARCSGAMRSRPSWARLPARSSSR